MFLGYQKGKIKFYTPNRLDKTKYNLDKIEETQDKYVLDMSLEEYVKVDEAYYAKKTQERQEEFETQFLMTPLGNFRLQPRGYANAQQSIDTINNMVTALGALTEPLAQMIIFYETPDFADETQCTEEWLVEHQHNPEPMSKEEWTEFYVTFSQLYAQKMYKLEIEENKEGA